MSAGLSWPPNAGMPWPPWRTQRSTVAALGLASSRLRPTLPLAPAALSVWQLPQLLSANTCAPRGAFFGRSDDAPPHPASAAAAAAAATAAVRGPVMAGPDP